MEYQKTQEQLKIKVHNEYDELMVKLEKAYIKYHEASRDLERKLIRNEMNLILRRKHNLNYKYEQILLDELQYMLELPDSETVNEILVIPTNDLSIKK